MPANLEVLKADLERTSREVPRDLDKVYVYPDGEVYEDMPSYMSDDCEIRYAGHCDKCEERITPHYGEPFASCGCETQEWHF